MIPIPLRPDLLNPSKNEAPKARSHWEFCISDIWFKVAGYQNGQNIGSAIYEYYLPVRIAFIHDRQSWIEHS